MILVCSESDGYKIAELMTLTSFIFQHAGGWVKDL